MHVIGGFPGELWCCSDRHGFLNDDDCLSDRARINDSSMYAGSTFRYDVRSIESPERLRSKHDVDSSSPAGCTHGRMQHAMRIDESLIQEGLHAQRVMRSSYCT